MSIKMFFFLLTLVLLQVVGAPFSESNQVLHELNHAFQTELNVFIDLEDLNVLHKLDTPRILISSSSREAGDLRICGNFTERAIIVVQLKDSKLDPKVANILPHLMHDLHELHIVFISGKEPEFLKDLFTYCFKQGFINVLLIHRQNLHSYLPYPSIQTIQLANISEYLKRGRIIRNFQGHPVRTLRTTLAPRDFEYFNDQDELVRSGYLFMAVKELTYRYNASLESVPLPDLPELESYAAVYKMLVTKKVDIICYFKDFRWNVAYTSPLSILSEYFMAPHARPLSSYLYYSRPFSWTLWLIVIATILYGTLMLYLTANRNEFGECLLHSLSHILYNSHQRIRTSGWRDIAIHVILTFGGFVLTNIYLATLSSILTSGLYEEEYKTLEDLAHAPYPNLHDEFYRKQVQRNEFIPLALRRNSISLNATLLKEYRDGLNKNYIYMLYEDRLELVLMQQYLLKTPRFNMIPQGVGYALESYCVSNSLPYLTMTSEFMRRLQEHGINSKMRADTFRELIQQGIYSLMRDDEPPAKAFDLDYYFFAFVLWAVGLAVSLLVFIAEVARRL
ncbi:uncharacterized protein Ir60e [Drosophila takahashii]|uniref:uncharacterized protein Ir60e n=1 Tax=Drosophila takahashii TaxID=29030 RepID=UPI001CF82A27|nr:uncharacterized protein LOC108069648 [Drosophila takahashii]